MPKSALETPLLWRKQDWAYTNLRSWILKGTLEPDQRIDQDALAADLNISRVPLRQALVRLHSEGLVEQRPHQRWLVSSMSLPNARDVYAGRGALECLLTRAAASLVTEQDVTDLVAILEAQEEALEAADLELARVHDRAFHNRIYQVTGFERTWQAQQQLRAMSDRYVAMFMSDIARARSSMTEHHAILDALRVQDAKKAAVLAAAHVEGGIKTLEELLAK